MSLRLLYLIFVRVVGWPVLWTDERFALDDPVAGHWLPSEIRFGACNHRSHSSVKYIWGRPGEVALSERGESEFDAFYVSTAPRLVSQLFLVTRDLTEAQDCVQEAYTRAWERWDVISRRTEDPAAWVWTVAWRIAASRWRRAGTHLRALWRHGAPQDMPGPSADVVAVRTAMQQLPVAQRAAIVLHYFAGLPVQEISTLLEVPTGTVKARLSRGRATLATLLADVDEPPDHLPDGQEQHHVR